VARELRVILQGADHAHDQVLAEQLLVHARVVEQHEALEDMEEVVQVRHVLQILYRVE